MVTPRGGPVSGRRRAITLALGALAVGFAVAAFSFLPRAKVPAVADAAAPEAPEAREARDRHDAGAEEVAFEDFVGAEACAGCHRAEYDRWKASTHGRAGGRPDEVSIIAQFDGRPRKFRDAVLVPEKKGADYIFTVQQPGQPDRVFKVDQVVGGGHLAGGGTQSFFSRFPDGTIRFLPFDFIRKESLWFCNGHTEQREGILPITPQLSINDCADWPPKRVLGDSGEHNNCQSCHGSQVQLTRDLGDAGFRTQLKTLAIDCEACHGPGRRHLERVANPKAVAAGDVGMKALSNLGKDSSLGVCFQCHAMKSTLSPGYLSGKPFDAYYSLLMPMLGGEESVHPDGRTRIFAYQQSHLWSDCYVRGGMTCTSCHDPHTQGYRDHVGRPLEGRFDDGQCTSCHASKRDAPEEHSHHARGSKGSRCVGCHMPYLQQPAFGRELRYARSDHTIPVPRPEQDRTLGIESACQTCHADLSVDAQRAKITKWYGEPKPVATAIDAAFRVQTIDDPLEAARLVLRADEPHTAALFMGIARFGAKFVAPDPPSLPDEVIERLDALSGHQDFDVRGLALAYLHMARGSNPRAAKRIDERRQETGTTGDRVRARWVHALVFYGEQARAHGALLRAVDLFQKALEIEPDRAEVVAGLGHAHAQGGKLGEAVRCFRRSLELDPVQPRTLLSLGEVLNDSHQADNAVDAWKRAVALDDSIAPAHMHLGEAALAAGNVDAALHHAGRALAIDPRLAPAHFLMGRLHERKGDRARALRALDDGLALEPENKAGRDARKRLLGGGALR